MTAAAATSSTTGDLHKNIETLKGLLRQIRFPALSPHDDDRLRSGDPGICLEILRFALLGFSASVAEELHRFSPKEAEYLEASAESDALALEACYRLLRGPLDYRPSLTSTQFASFAFTERKIIQCQDVIRIVKQMHANLLKRRHQRLSTSGRNEEQSPASEIRKIRGFRRGVREVAPFQRGRRASSPSLSAACDSPFSSVSVPPDTSRWNGGGWRSMKGRREGAGAGASGDPAMERRLGILEAMAERWTEDFALLSARIEKIEDILEIASKQKSRGVGAGKWKRETAPAAGNRETEGAGCATAERALSELHSLFSALTSDSPLRSTTGAPPPPPHPLSRAFPGINGSPLGFEDAALGSAQPPPGRSWPPRDPPRPTPVNLGPLTGEVPKPRRPPPLPQRTPGFGGVESPPVAAAPPLAARESGGLILGRWGGGR